jgi:ribosome biogenesis GTPase
LEGIVIRSTGSWYTVRTADAKLRECRIKGKFRIQGIKATNPVSVGDRVEIELQDDGGIITEIAPRNNYIIRKSTNLSKQVHIIAANIDQAFLLVTISHPNTSTGFIDRFLVTAEAYHIPVTLIFNKIDLYEGKAAEKLEELIATYEYIGYPCMQVSATEGTGVEEVKALMKDKVTLMSGHSGVGKSTLINTIDKELDLKTDIISESHKKGKHTTTFAEMFELDFGGFIIDTPGIKGFGIVDLEKAELSHYFPEMRERLMDCKFNNCTHINEPGCDIKAAVEEGLLPESRYINYVMLYESDEKSSYR